MKVHLLWQLILFVGCAVLALLTFGDKTEETKNSIVVLDAALSDVRRVEYVGEGKKIVVTPDDVVNKKWIVELTRDAIEKKKSPIRANEKNGDAGILDAGGADGQDEKPREMTFRFPASKNLVRSLEKLIPVSAKRNLGTVDEEMKESMGFKESSERLIVETTKGTHQWTLGGKTYGNQGRYATTSTANDAYLLPMAMLRGFDGNETRLADRKLIDFDTSEILSFSINRKASKLEFRQHERDQINKRYFSRLDMPDIPSEDAKKFIAAVRALRVSRYVDADAINDIPLQATIHFGLDNERNVKGQIFTSAQGHGYLSVPPWVGELKESTVREILDDLDVLMQ